MEEAVRKIATNTIGYTRKQAGKEWFDEECEKANEEKHACSECHPKTNENSKQQI
jgi:hypothetical protein